MPAIPPKQGRFWNIHYITNEHSTKNKWDKQFSLLKKLVSISRGCPVAIPKVCRVIASQSHRGVIVSPGAQSGLEVVWPEDCWTVLTMPSWKTFRNGVSRPPKSSLQQRVPSTLQTLWTLANAIGYPPKLNRKALLLWHHTPMTQNTEKSPGYSPKIFTYPN